MSFIFTRVQERRMHAPNEFGMHPEAARILALRGVDPEHLGRRYSATTQSAHVAVGRLSGFTLGQPFDVRPPGAQGFDARAFGAPGVNLQGFAHDPRVQRFFEGLAGTPYTDVPRRFHETFGLDPGDAIVTQLLTQAALDWRNFETIHTRVSPLQTEKDVAGTYFEYDRSGQRQVVESRIGPNGQVREVSRRVSARNYQTEPRALQGTIQRLAAAVAPTLNLLSTETEFVMGLHDREMERDVAQGLGDPANYPASNVLTLGSTFRWNGGSAATPVDNVLTILLAIPAHVNHCVFSDLAWAAAQVNAQLQQILFGRFRATDGVLSPAEFAQFFGIENVWISKHIVEDPPGTVRRTWSESDAWFGHVNPARDMLTHTRRFRTVIGGNGGLGVRPYFDPGGAYGRDKVVVTRHDSGLYVVGADFGGLIRGVRQTS